jgi:GNAT superfamily N-acetyltransferase
VIAETPNIRVGVGADMLEMAALLVRYMRESLGRSWEGSVDDLQTGLGRHFQAAVACTTQAMIGFAVWHMTYDVHHCASGGEISDVYVLPGNRGRGIAPTLMAFVAGEVLKAGGRFIKGHIGEPAEAFYRKIAVVCEGREVYIGGRALRTLAKRADAGSQRVVRRFPALSENFEP